MPVIIETQADWEKLQDEGRLSYSYISGYTHGSSSIENRGMHLSGNIQLCIYPFSVYGPPTTSDYENWKTIQVEYADRRSGNRSAQVITVRLAENLSGNYVTDKTTMVGDTIGKRVIFTREQLEKAGYDYYKNSLVIMIGPDTLYTQTQLVIDSVIIS